MSTLRDYSTHVEVLLHEEDACLHAGGPSDADLARTFPRIWRELEAAGPIVTGPGLPSLIMLSLQRYETFEAFGNGSVATHDVGAPHSGWLRNDCPFCGARKPTVRTEAEGDRSIAVSACVECGWWESEDVTLLESDNHYDAFVFCRRALLREFDISDVNAPLSAVRTHLLRQRNDLRLLSPHVLEVLIGNVLSEHLNCEVIHVGGPGDGGIDLLAVDADRPWAIQVKRRGPTVGHESVAPVREFVGALITAGHRRGMFVTTAPHFTQAARTTSEKAAASLAIDRVELLDGGALASIMDLHPVPDAWELGAPSLSQPRGDYSPSRRLYAFDIGAENTRAT